MNDLTAAFRDRYSTALLADAAYRAGAPVSAPPAGLAPLRQRDKLAGPVVTVQANNDLVSILGAVHRARPGDVVVIANQTPVGIIGDLIAIEARRKGLGGIIVDGLVRDAVALVEIGLPIFSRGRLPVGPLKLAPALKGVGEVGVELTLGEIQVKPGDWAFGDADGVIFIAAADLAATHEWAEKSWQREEALAAEMRAGKALGDLVEIEAFLEKRGQDPSADFNEHLARLGRAI
jgi:4-hydroxy-4-methyl-2-oxoglutarate aldolase